MPATLPASPSESYRTTFLRTHVAAELAGDAGNRPSPGEEVMGLEVLRLRLRESFGYVAEGDARRIAESVTLADFFYGRRRRAGRAAAVL